MKDLEIKVYQHLKARKWDNLRPVDVAKSIMIEGAELLELFQWENLSLEEVKKNKKKISEIKKELADRVKHQLRRIPVLHFYLDDTLDYVFKMEEIFKQIGEEKKEDTPPAE